MDEVQMIQSLARALNNAAKNHDWDKVQQIDQQIAELLGNLQSQPLSTQVSAALTALKDIHKKIYDYCCRHKGELERKMSDTRRNHEGASAYAIVMATEELA